MLIYLVGDIPNGLPDGDHHEPEDERFLATPIRGDASLSLSRQFNEALHGRVCSHVIVYSPISIHLDREGSEN